MCSTIILVVIEPIYNTICSTLDIPLKSGYLATKTSQSCCMLAKSLGVGRSVIGSMSDVSGGESE